MANRRNFSEMNPVTLGVIGATLAALMLLVSLNADRLVGLFAHNTYGALVSEAGGIRVDDEVLVAGMKVGRVKEVRLEGTAVRVVFTVDSDIHVGDQSHAAIKTRDPLGKMYLQIEPAGEREMEPGTDIPLERTTEPYDLNEVIQDLTGHVTEIDSGRLAAALDTLSSQFRDTPPELRAMVRGVSRLSKTISSRDAELRELLSRFRGVSDVLDQRRAELVTLFGDGQILFAALNERQKMIDELLVNIDNVTRQISGLVDDNRSQLRPVLAQLREASAMLNRNSEHLKGTIRGVHQYALTLADILGATPTWYGYFNLGATNMAPILSSMLGKADK